MFGLDLNKLPGQFEGSSNGVTLISDADEAIYLAAATTSNLETAKRRFVQEILTQKFLAKAEFVRIHMTTRDSWKGGRFEIKDSVKPYQGNRDGAKKPPLVEPLRQVVAARRLDIPEDWYINLESELEADDSCMIDSWQYKESGVLYSADKDLRHTPYPILDPKTKSVRPSVTGIGKLWLHQLSRSQSLLGHGPIFFWAQCLMGDGADHIKGITKFDGKQCGPVKTFELLEEFQEQPDEKAVARFVMDAYERNGQAFLPEAYLLWMRRTRDNTIQEHLKWLGLLS